MPSVKLSPVNEFEFILFNGSQNLRTSTGGITGTGRGGLCMFCITADS